MNVQERETLMRAYSDARVVRVRLGETAEAAPETLGEPDFVDAYGWLLKALDNLGAALNENAHKDESEAGYDVFFDNTDIKPFLDSLRKK